MEGTTDADTDPAAVTVFFGVGGEGGLGRGVRGGGGGGVRWRGRRLRLAETAKAKEAAVRMGRSPPAGPPLRYAPPLSHLVVVQGIDLHVGTGGASSRPALRADLAGGCLVRAQGGSELPAALREDASYLWAFWWSPSACELQNLREIEKLGKKKMALTTTKSAALILG
jgi:hypothetical protein